MLGLHLAFFFTTPLTGSQSFPVLSTPRGILEYFRALPRALRALEGASDQQDLT